MVAPETRIGPYLIKRPIGRGATGSVYQAFNTETNTPVAVKFLAADLMDEPTMVALFEEEAKAGAQIHHPNIVETLELGRFHGRPYMVFELVVGVPLADLLTQNAMLPEGQCIWILRQMGQALRELHKKGVVHQDIKPDNILIQADGVCKLVDLGYARRRGGKIDWDGLAAGTAYYMSPEQCLAQHDRSVDSRSDIYALGCTIYHAATGTPPFVAENEEDIFEMHVKQDAVPANRHNSKLSVGFANILERMLRKAPEARYPRPEELLLEMRTLTTPAEPPVVTGSRFRE